MRSALRRTALASLGLALMLALSPACTGTESGNPSMGLGGSGGSGGTSGSSAGAGGAGTGGSGGAGTSGSGGGGTGGSGGAGAGTGGAGGSIDEDAGAPLGDADAGWE